MTLTTIQDTSSRTAGRKYQYPQNRSRNENPVNPVNPISLAKPVTPYPQPQPRTKPSSTGSGSIGSGPTSKSSLGGSKSSLSSVSYAVAIPVRQSQDVGKLLADIESKPILIETTEDLDLSMSLTKTPSMWSLNDTADGSMNSGNPASVSSRNSRVSFISASSLAGSAWNVVPPPESSTIVDTVTALYLPIIAIFLIGLSILFTVVSFTNPYWMMMYGQVKNETACPIPRTQNVMFIGLLDACTGYLTDYNCDEDNSLVQAVSAIFRLGVSVFWVGLVLVFFQMFHQIRQTMFIGSNTQTFELRKADRKAYGRHKAIQILVLIGICVCTILSSLCFIIAMAVMSTKEDYEYTKSGSHFRPSFVTTGIAAALTMFCGCITSGQIFYHVSGTRAQTTIALSPGVKFVKTFQAVAPEEEEDEDGPSFNGEGSRLEMSVDSRNQRSDSVDDDFRNLPIDRSYPTLEKARKVPGRIPSITQKLEDRDTLLKRSLGRSQSKRTAPQAPNAAGTSSAPLQKSYDTHRKRSPYEYNYNAKGETATSRDKAPYSATTSRDKAPYLAITSRDNAPYVTTASQNLTKPVTRTESNRDTSIPAHYNRPRPKPSFRQVRAKKPQAPQQPVQELQLQPTRIANNSQSYDYNHASQQKPVNTVADVHASGYRSTVI